MSLDAGNNRCRILSRGKKKRKSVMARERAERIERTEREREEKSPYRYAAVSRLSRDRAFHTGVDLGDWTPRAPRVSEGGWAGRGRGSSTRERPWYFPLPWSLSREGWRCVPGKQRGVPGGFLWQQQVAKQGTSRVLIRPSCQNQQSPCLLTKSRGRPPARRARYKRQTGLHSRDQTHLCRLVPRRTRCLGR